MKRFLMMLGLALCVATPTLAQSAPATAAPKPEAKPAAATLPTVDQLLEKYVAALGGKEALEKVTSRVSKGSFEIPAMGASGAFESVEKAPNQTATTIDIPGFGTLNIVFDGKNGYQKDPMQGLREASGAELAMMKLDAEMYGALKMKSLYKSLEVKSKEKVATGEAYLLVATPNEGSPVKLYFAADTYLLVRREAETDSPQGKMPTEATMEDYRTVDGIKIPFVIKTNTPAVSFVVKVEEVKQNVPVDAAKFAKP